jgi:FtsP/CotA-like multicopper oxidase with cupredoxin domain
VLVRRITLALCAIFLLAVIGAAFADRKAQDSRAIAPPVTIATGPPPAVVRGTLPDQGIVRAREGDAVTVSVRTAMVDEATVQALGITASTSAEVPGMLEFVATAAGRYPVLLDSGESAGTIVIGPRRAR